MASRREIAAEQQRLKDAGHYKGPVDGVDGPGTRDARAAYQRASEMAGANKAQAEAQKADAEARSAEARVKAIEAEAKAAKQKSDAENAGVNRATQVAMNVGAAAAGVGIGHAVAARIEKRQSATMEARAAQAKAVGAEARKVIGKGVKPKAAGAGQVAKLQGVVAAANKLDIGKVKGPKGLAAAGVLLAEAAISRFVVAPQLENETAREAVNSVATLGVFGATTILGERAIANATPKNLPSGKDLVAIEQARAIVDAKDTPKIEPEKAKAPKTPKAKALPKPSAMSKITQGAGQIAKGAAKYALPIVAGVVGATTFAKTGSAAEAGKAAGDVVTSGGVSYYDQARTAGMSKPRAVAEGVVRGAYSMATFGLFDKKLTVPGSNQAKVNAIRGRLDNFSPRPSASDGELVVTGAATSVFGSIIAADAKRDLAAVPRDYKSSRAGLRLARGFGLVGKYGGLAVAAAGAFSLATRKASASQPSQPQGRDDYRNGLLEMAGGQRINNANPNPASRARERVRMGIEAAPLTRGLSAAQKRDYAKASARKASERQSAKPVKSDGMTDPYVRMQNGKSVQVGGYRTVLPK